MRDASREKRDVACTHTSDTRVAEKTSSAMIARRCLQSVYNCISAEWACSVSSRVKWATTIYMRAYIARYDGAKCFCYFPFFLFSLSLSIGSEMQSQRERKYLEAVRMHFFDKVVIIIETYIFIRINYKRRERMLIFERDYDSGFRSHFLNKIAI